MEFAVSDQGCASVAACIHHAKSSWFDTARQSLFAGPIVAALNGTSRQPAMRFAALPISPRMEGMGRAVGLTTAGEVAAQRPSE